MAIQINQTPVYTVKFLDADGIEKFQDYPAAGTWAAEQAWKKEHPNTTLINIFRKS